MAPKGIGYGKRLKSKLRRRIKEVIGGKNTYRKGEIELKAGEATRKIRRVKNRAAAKPMVGKETIVQKKQQDSTPSYLEWLEQTGKGATARTASQYSRMKKRNQ